MIKNQEIKGKGSSTLGLLFYEKMRVFQSLLDYKGDKYLSKLLCHSLSACIHFVQFLNASSCSLITIFKIFQI